MPTTRRAVLLVWNPLHEPRSIEVHVEHLRTGSATWWGRIYGRPRETPTRGPSPAVTTMVDRTRRHVEQALAEAGEVTVFVTNHTSLHALRVTEVRGAEARPPLDAIPEYYRDKLALQWFKVVDVRALSYDQTSTLDYLREVRFAREVLDVAGPWPRVGEAATEFHGYDPFASMAYRYPLPVELADDADPTFWQPPEGLRRFVDDEEAAFPHALLAALERLEGRVPALWGRISRPARLLVANGEVSRDALGSRSSFGLASAILGLATAVEHELREGLVLPLLVHTLPEVAPPPVVTLRRHFEEAGYPWSRNLGGLQIALGGIAATLAKSGLAPRYPELHGLGDQRKPGSDLAALTALRNDVAHHKRSVGQGDFADAWERALGRPTGALLDRIVSARDEIAALGLV